MDPGRIAVRALFAFVFLHVLMRLAGKRLLAQATGFDFVLALILGDMIDDALWAEVPFAQFVVATAALVATQLLVGLAAFSSGTVASAVGGTPRIVVRDGLRLRPPCRRERMNESEVEEQLRLHGLERRDWPQVRSGWVERSGRIGILLHQWARPATRSDLERVRRAATRKRS